MSIFCSTALIPSILQVIIVTSSAYSVGIDVETRHRLRILGGWAAEYGRPWPGRCCLTQYCSCWCSACRTSCCSWIWNCRCTDASWLLTSQACCSSCRVSFSARCLRCCSGRSPVRSASATLLTSPAFGFMGIGFPRLGMNAFAYGYGALLPGTWYLTARIDQTIRGTPLDLSWKPVLVLLAFDVSLAGLAAWAWKSSARAPIARPAARRRYWRKPCHERRSTCSGTNCGAFSR